MELGALRRTQTRIGSCVMCGDPAPAEHSLCSRDCLVAARRELDANVASLQGRGDTAEQQATLVERNGELSAAMIAWSP
ncbi:hypothetical protein [Egicoccus sp. AB-alg6-2]|uniref:hypothetical protein n=1 Tax=Egicoccus sp. AB-alg6-2 TaxID=3242692 RepID=UPI00359CF988